MAATYESVAKEFPDLPKKRIEGIVAQRNSAPDREAAAKKRYEESTARRNELMKQSNERRRAERAALNTKIKEQKEKAYQIQQAELAKAKSAYEAEQAKKPAAVRAIESIGGRSGGFDPTNPLHKNFHRQISPEEFDKRLTALQAATPQEKEAANRKLLSRFAAPPVAPTPTPSTTVPTPIFGENFGFASPDEVGYVPTYPAFKKGGKVTAKKYAKGGKVSSAPKAAKASTASRRGDGIAQRGKTKGRMV